MTDRQQTSILHKLAFKVRKQLGEFICMRSHYAMGFWYQTGAKIQRSAESYADKHGVSY